MRCISYKTVYANQQTITKRWFVVDASGQPLGRLASKIAFMIRGKHKPTFTPHVDGGDHIIVLNAEKVALSGNKEVKKVYTRHTGYPGGVRTTTPKHLRQLHPERIIEYAVRRMLPKNRLGRKIFNNLHVCSGLHHKHVAQKPTQISL